MNLLFNILLCLILAAVGFLLNLMLIYYAVAFVLLALYWAFFATAVGWYAVFAFVVVIALYRMRSASNPKVSQEQSAMSQFSWKLGISIGSYR